MRGEPAKILLGRPEEEVCELGNIFAESGRLWGRADMGRPKQESQS